MNKLATIFHSVIIFSASISIGADGNGKNDDYRDSDVSIELFRIDDKRSITIEINEQGEAFLGIEPGCGRYRITVVSRVDNVLRIKIEERLGASIDISGKIVDTKSFVGKLFEIKINKDKSVEVNEVDR